MSHELDKLDAFLGTPVGTACAVLTSHADPTAINEKLVQFGIILDKFGMVPKPQREAWKALMQRVGVAQRYWKDPYLLVAENQIIVGL